MDNTFFIFLGRNWSRNPNSADFLENCQNPLKYFWISVKHRFPIVENRTFLRLCMRIIHNRKWYFSIVFFVPDNYSHLCVHPSFERFYPQRLFIPFLFKIFCYLAFLGACVYTILLLRRKWSRKRKAKQNVSIHDARSTWLPTGKCLFVIL